MTNLLQPRRITLSDEVLSQNIGNETVLLDLKGEAYFGLDEVASSIWSLLAQGCDTHEIVSRLLAEYDVGRERLEKDVQQLVNKLLEHELAIVDPD